MKGDFKIYFMKYKGDLLWKKGLRNEAMAEYLKARECTNNGIVQLELDKFLKKQWISCMKSGRIERIQMRMVNYGLL